MTPEHARQAFDYRHRWSSEPQPASIPGDDIVKAWVAYEAARLAAIEACREGASEDLGCVFEIVVDPIRI